MDIMNMSGSRNGTIRGMTSRRPRVGPAPGHRRRQSGLEALEPRCLLALLFVTNTDDAGVGTLRAAIEEANLDPSSDTIVFDEGVAGTITLRSALPDLSTEVVLVGSDAGDLTIARDRTAGTPDFRLFNVTETAQVSLRGLTLTGGRVAPFDFSQPGGGAILNAGRLTLTRVRLEDNSAGGRGGALFNSGMLEVREQRGRGKPRTRRRGGSIPKGT